MGYEYHHLIESIENFVRKYIRYASQLSDSPWDYHEAMALFILACATHGLKLYIPSHPYGLRTNMYMLFYGDSVRMRKSTAMNRGRFIMDRAIPWCQLPENFTPGGLEEAMANKPNQGTAVVSDEFTFHLEKMMKAQYMTGVRGFFLTMYNQENWKYKRTSKGSGKEKKEDIVEITNAHFNIIGNLTPAICGELSERDMKDGFLGRFVFIHPSKKPPRIPLDEFIEENVKLRQELVSYIEKVVQFCDNMKLAREQNNKFQPIEISKAGLKIIDAFQEKVETQNYTSHSIGTMAQRMPDYCLKVAMLLAVGEFQPEIAARILVDRDDAKQAVKICTKWMNWGIDIGGELGRNPFEDKIQRALGIVFKHGIVPRSIVARVSHCTKPEMDVIQSTLLDRGSIYVAPIKKKGSQKPTLMWRHCDYNPEEREEENGRIESNH